MTPRTTLLPSLATLALLIGCSNDKSTTPEDGPDDFPLVASETIGTAGGTLESDDFRLEVPAGALAEDTELSLYASSTEQPFPSSGVTAFYRLEGLPEDSAEPLSLQIRYSGALADESFLAIGAERTVALNSFSETVYTFAPAEVSNGFLMAQIGGEETRGGIVAGPPARSQQHLRITGISSYRTYPQTEPFILEYPSSLAPLMDDLYTILLEAHQIIESELGLSFDLAAWSTPIGVYLDPNATQVNPVALPYGRSAPIIYIPVSDMNPMDADELRIDLGRCLVYLLSLRYVGEDTENAWMYEWFHRAVAIWSETVFTDVLPTTVPSGAASFEMALFAGLNEPSLQSDDVNGLAALIRYVIDVSSCKENGLTSIFQWMQSVSSWEAVLECDGAPANQVWPGFFTSYLTGQIYDIPFTTFAESASGTWNVDTALDVEREFVLPAETLYHDLSARLFWIDFNYRNYPTSELHLTATSTDVPYDDIAVIVYGVESNEAEVVVLDEGSPEVRIPDLGLYLDQGFDGLAVVVVNSRLPEISGRETSIGLRAEIVDVEQPTTVNLWSGVLCRLRVIYPESPENNRDYEDMVIMGPYAETGEFTSDTTFVATWDRTGDADDRNEGEIRIVFSADRESVLSVALWHRYRWPGLGNYELNQSFTMVNIPRVENEYTIEGPEILSHITHYEYGSTSDESEEVLLDILGSELSRIRILLQ